MFLSLLFFCRMTNPGVHFVLKISQYILLSFLEVTVSYGQLAFSSGFFSLVYWDHDGDDILQGNHITVGQRRKKETGQRHWHWPGRGFFVPPMLFDVIRAVYQMNLTVINSGEFFLVKFSQEESVSRLGGGSWSAENWPDCWTNELPLLYSTPCAFPVSIVS